MTQAFTGKLSLLDLCDNSRTPVDASLSSGDPVGLVEPQQAAELRDDAWQQKVAKFALVVFTCLHILLSLSVSLSLSLLVKVLVAFQSDKVGLPFRLS